MSLTAYHLEHGRHVFPPWLRDFIAAAVVLIVRTRPRTIPLAMITMRKSTHGFASLSYTYLIMGLRLEALRAAGTPL